jgi:hypothetical protein
MKGALVGFGIAAVGALALFLILNRDQRPPNDPDPDRPPIVVSEGTVVLNLEQTGNKTWTWEQPSGSDKKKWRPKHANQKGKSVQSYTVQIPKTGTCKQQDVTGAHFVIGRYQTGNDSEAKHDWFALFLDTEEAGRRGPRLESSFEFAPDSSDRSQIKSGLDFKDIASLMVFGGTYVECKPGKDWTFKLLSQH